MRHGPRVLVLARAVDGPAVGQTLSGAAQRLADVDGALLVLRADGAPGTGSRPVLARPDPSLPVPHVGWSTVDGAVLLPGAAGPEEVAELRRRGVPFVVVGPDAPATDAPLVVPADGDTTGVVVEHLVEHGHRRVVFVGDLADPATACLHEAYGRSAAAHRLESAVLDVPGGELTGPAVEAALVDLLADPPRAAVVATDQLARALMTRLATVGLRVPHDLAVVALSGEETNAFSTPSLSTISRQWYEVGTLATDLLLRLVSLELVEHGPHEPSPPALAARGSCGCTPDLLGEQNLPTRREDVPAVELRERLRRLLHDAFAHGARDDWSARETARQAVRDVDTLLDGEGLGTALAMREVITHLHRLARRPEVLHRAADAINEYVHRSIAEHALSAGGGPSPKAGRISGALWQLQAAAHLRQQQALELSVKEQFRVAFTLLDRTTGDPRDLAWLAGTRVRAGVLGLWSGPPGRGALDVVGVHDPTGTAGVEVGSRVDVEAFPPASLAAVASTADEEACFVLPVRDARGDWGLLALVGRIDLTASREAYHHWATSLSTAFEAEARDREIARNEQRNAHIARATHDGLWEWEVGDARLYLSRTARDLLGLGAEPVAIRDALRLVRADDVSRVTGAMRRARAVGGRPVDVEVRLRQPVGGLSWVQLRVVGLQEDDGAVPRLLGSLSDIGERKALEAELRRNALHDAVTGLPNRRLFLQRLDEALAVRRRDPDRRFAVLFLDLDGFKGVNDTLGHAAGDRLLVAVAGRLQACLRPDDVAARFGGDEFALLVAGAGPEEAQEVARRVRDAVAAPVALGQEQVAVTASIGMATSDRATAGGEELLRVADSAMYRAKAARRGSVA